MCFTDPVMPPAGCFTYCIHIEKSKLQLFSVMSSSDALVRRVLNERLNSLKWIRVVNLKKNFTFSFLTLETPAESGMCVILL